MKRILFFTLTLCSLITKAQNLVVQNGASFIASGTPTLVFNNIGLDAASNTIDLQNANLVVSGNANVMLKNSSAFINLQKLTVDKPGAVLTIANNVQVFTGVQMVAGLFDLSGKNLYLSSNSVITGETEATRITGTTGGYIQTVANLSNANNLNPGNMGVYITTAANIGLVTINRGHKAQTGTGLSSGINRYYEFNPPNTAMNATLKFSYFDVELNGQVEAGLQLLESSNNGSLWTNKTIANKDAVANTVVVADLNNLFRYTVGTATNGPLPVLGLEFFAKRLNNQQVQLNWKTAQEIDNKGFYIERKREAETSFASKDFVPTNAPRGSSSPLSYTFVDSNSFTGKTYYRIKQTDINGAFSYSLIKVVDGSKSIGLTVWPVPAIGFINVRLEGNITDALQVWNAGGELVKQLPLAGGQTIKIDGLSAGTYLLRLKSQPDGVQKIVMQ